MNFLAHVYLSENNPKIIIGNFIADHVIGNKYNHFDAEIQQGIKLHRHIDTFTDAHPIVRKSKRRLHERYGHFDGIIIDLFYDYFLAKNWNDYSEIPLKLYSQGIYTLLQNNLDILPSKTKKILPYLIEYDWLFNYQFFDGMEKVLIGMNKRTKGRSKMNEAITDLKNLEKEFEADFTSFFKDLRIFSAQKLKEIQQNK